MKKSDLLVTFDSLQLHQHFEFRTRSPFRKSFPDGGEKVNPTMFAPLGDLQTYGINYVRTRLSFIDTLVWPVVEFDTLRTGQLFYWAPSNHWMGKLIHQKVGQSALCKEHNWLRGLSDVQQHYNVIVIPDKDEP